METFAFIFQSIGKGKKKMLNQRQIDRMLTKLERFEHTLERCYFEKVGELDMRAYPADGSHHAIPEDSLFRPVKPNELMNNLLCRRFFPAARWSLFQIAQMLTARRKIADIMKSANVTQGKSV